MLNPLFINLHACSLLQLFPSCPIFQVKFFLQLSLATWCEELTHLKRPWYWERLRAGGEGDDRGWDGWMASPTQWTWVWVNSGNWWWTGRPGVLRSMRSQRVRHDWTTELNWMDVQLLLRVTFGRGTHRLACRILAPRSRIEPGSLQWKC